MKGLIFIPDISGFTSFVKNVDIDLGVSITEALLTAIINGNPLNVQLSEIEGDAILFYKIGKPLPLKKVFHGIKIIYEAFDTQFKILKELHGLDIILSLKFIVHYGDINVYKIKGFRKLFGQTVIEAHSLLKNGYDASHYILITDDYFTALNQTTSDVTVDNWKYATSSSITSNGSREISFYFFIYVPTGSFQYPYSSNALKPGVKARSLR